VKNFRISAPGVFRIPKTANIGTVKGGVSAQSTAQTAQFWAMKIILGASLHPKDVPFTREFWWGTYCLGARSPQRKQILAISSRRLHCVLKTSATA